MALEIRKIESAEESERKRKRNTLILSILMIAILLFSTAGYFSMRDNEDTTNSNKNVENIGDSWILKYGDQSLRLSNSPESAENVSILMFKNLESYYGKTVYVAYENEVQFYEVASTLGRYTERMQPACYGKCEKDFPEKTCNDTMIVIKNLNETEPGKSKIYEEDNCLFIEGNLVAVDAFIYKIFGVN
jgi:hypothetical protein